ncbi:MAG: hypothetical protein AAF702_04380 [Chloroflexota bacterium]
MIISHKHRYVYIGIPRTASKSTSRWLVEHYDGEWVGFHHEWRVPEKAFDYLIFTVVRNPYERMASGMLAVLWGDIQPNPARRVPSPIPEPSTEPREKRVQEARLIGKATILDDSSSVPEDGMNQSHFIKKAGISLVLFFERLPECLGNLPFVDQDNLPPFPHVLERGIRPPGTFFDHFSDEEEQVTWAFAAEDFELLGYERYSPSLPSASSSWQHIEGLGQ